MSVLILNSMIVMILPIVWTPLEVSCACVELDTLGMEKTVQVCKFLLQE